jgi:hypothetical protein
LARSLLRDPARAPLGRPRAGRALRAVAAAGLAVAVAALFASGARSGEVRVERVTPIAPSAAVGAGALPAGTVQPFRPADALPDASFQNACAPEDPAPAGRLPRSAEALRRVLGPDFRVARRGTWLVASDLPEADWTLLVDAVLPCCRQSLARDFFRTAPTGTILLFVFRDTGSYEAGLRRVFRMAPVSPYGHYAHAGGYLAVNWETGPGTLVHELTHALMAPDFPEAPIWIAEGIASLYEQSRVEGETLKGEANWRLPELRAALGSGSLPPLTGLLTMDVTAFRARRESLHYAMSRYFCKYMEEKGLLRPVYRAFRDGYDRDPTGRLFVEEAFGQDLETIEAGWRAWLDTQTWD